MRTDRTDALEDDMAEIIDLAAVRRARTRSGGAADAVAAARRAEAAHRAAAERGRRLMERLRADRSPSP